MEQKNGVVIVHRDAFQVIGLKWEGTFAEAGAGGIRAVQKQMQERFNEIQNVVHPDTLLGLSYHSRPDGFTHYSVVQVETVGEIPQGMASISVPALSCALCQHTKGQDIDASYQNIFAWIEQQGYKLNQQDVTHFEEYPMAQNPYSDDPEFSIMIPIIV